MITAMSNAPTPQYSNFGTTGQAQPYGQPTVTVTSTIPATPAKPHKEINWGGVVKGAAIVAGVAVAAVVGYVALNFAAGFVMQAVVGSVPANMWASGAVQAANWGAGLLGTAYAYASGFLGAFGSWLATVPGTVGAAIGLTPQLTAASGAAVAHTAGIVGAGAVGAAALHTAVPALGQIDYTQTVAGTAAATSLHSAHAAHTMAEMAHMSHHAAEHAHHSNWTDRFTSKAGNAQTFANTVASRQPIDMTPRDGNFAAQLEAETAQLNKQLGK